jgi:AraC-like DNA-binding protein
MVRVPNSFVPSAVSFALRLGVSPERLFSLAGLDLASARRPGASFTVQDVERLVDGLIEQSQIPDLGLRLGEHIDPEHLSCFGRLVATAATPRQALEAFSRFKYLLHPALDVVVEEKDGLAHLRYASRDGAAIGDRPYYAEALFSGFVMLGRPLVGDTQPVKVQFRHARPTYDAAYARIFRCPVAFDQPIDVLVTHASSLDRPMLSHSEPYHRALCEEARRELERLDAYELEQVRRAIASALDDPTLSLRRVAKSLAMSPRTLQRRLGERHRSFRSLHDEIRYSRAQELLARPGSSVDAVAHALGYRDRSNFVRAFRRWSGQSPRDYRVSARAVASGAK